MRWDVHCHEVAPGLDDRGGTGGTGESQGKRGLEGGGTRLKGAISRPSFEYHRPLVARLAKR